VQLWPEHWENEVVCLVNLVEQSDAALLPPSPKQPGYGGTSRSTRGGTFEANMQFTPREIKLIENLRKQQRFWPKARYIFLCSGILMSGLCAVLLSLAIQAFREDAKFKEVLMSELEELPPDQIGKHILQFLPRWHEEALGVALFVPFWCIFAVFAISRLTIVTIYWRGHPDRILLLKLAEAQLSQTSGDKHDT